MVLVACGCLVALILVYMFRGRGRDRRRADETEGSALDRGLAHLIKDISRTPLEPSLPRTTTPIHATSRRLARGSDLLPTARTPVQPVQPRQLRQLRKTGFEADDDAPTTTLQTFDARQRERRQ
jgi:hypothetical protein